MSENWGKVIINARDQLARLEAQREGIDNRILQLKRIIAAASGMVEDDSELASAIRKEIDALGITEHCREIFKGTRRCLTPLQIREELSAKGMDLSKQKNIMASIHTVMKRLVAKGEVLVERASDGGTVYRSRYPHALTQATRKHRKAEAALAALKGAGELGPPTKESEL
ncbi:MAG: hypothetical protein ACLQVM_03405 [Terriglobia bacterium]